VCRVYAHAEEEDLKKYSQTAWNAVHDWHPIWEEAVPSSEQRPYKELHSDSNAANLSDRFMGTRAFRNEIQARFLTNATAAPVCLFLAMYQLQMSAHSVIMPLNSSPASKTGSPWFKVLSRAIRRRPGFDSQQVLGFSLLHSVQTDSGASPNRLVPVAQT
jgi:hypothetical protein